MRYSRRTTLFTAVAAALVAGCSSTAPQRPEVPVAAAQVPSAAEQQAAAQRDALQRQLQQRANELSERERQVATRQQEAERRLKAAQDAELEARVKREAAEKASQGGVAVARAPAISKTTDAGLVPPNAVAGECYARVLTPPKYRTATERVLARAADERVVIVPAKYGPATEQVLVRAASKRLEVVPAVFETEEEQVLVRAASKRIVEVPAEYETKSERVMVKPATTVWKKGVTGPITRVDAATGEVLCLVEEPAEYKTITSRVVKRAASTREVEVPAEYTTVRRQVMKSPPTTREVEIPAEYKTVTVNKVVEPAREARVPVPAEYQTVTRTEMIEDSRVEWRSILCETNATPAKITEIQRALQRVGYNPGRIDGRLTRETQTAINKYQSSKGLPVDNFLNIETVKSLGVNPR